MLTRNHQILASFMNLVPQYTFILEVHSTHITRVSICTTKSVPSIECSIVIFYQYYENSVRNNVYSDWFLDNISIVLALSCD